MSQTDMSSETNVTDNPRMFAALRILEKVTPPTLYGAEPYWRAPITVKPHEVHIPSWNWTADYRQLDEGETPITLDCNGAYLAAIGSVEVAHGNLKHSGELDAWELEPRRVLPGYYRIEAFNWPFDATIVHPLGNVRTYAHGTPVWVAAPTLVLLLELLGEGTIGHLIISDSFTCERRTNFREWNKRLKAARLGLLDQLAKADTEDAIAHARARYQAFKEGYGAATSMMLTGAKCHTRRPDWTHAIQAQHAATSWRKAWRFSAGAPLLAMGDTDTLTVIEADLRKLTLSTQPPVKLDPSGRTLGHYKKAEPKQPAPAPDLGPDAPDFITGDDFGDIL